MTLKTDKAVTNLYLNNCNIGTIGEGMKVFGEALADNKTLKLLRFYNNQIGDLGAGILAESLKINTGLEVVFLVKMT